MKSLTKALLATSVSTALLFSGGVLAWDDDSEHDDELVAINGMTAADNEYLVVINLHAGAALGNASLEIARSGDDEKSGVIYVDEDLMFGSSVTATAPFMLTTDDLSDLPFENFTATCTAFDPISTKEPDKYVDARRIEIQVPDAQAVPVFSMSESPVNEYTDEELLAKGKGNPGSIAATQTYMLRPHSFMADVDCIATYVPFKEHVARGNRQYVGSITLDVISTEG